MASKSRYTVENPIEMRTRRDSDKSEQIVSEEDSDVSSVDFEAEEGFLAGEEIALETPSEDDSVEECMPSFGSKRPRVETEESSSSSDEQPRLPRGGTRGRGRGRGQGRGRGRGRSTTSNGGSSSIGVEDEDTALPQPVFQPKALPGPRLVSTENYTALQLFQLFFTNSVLQTIVDNTNEFGAVHHSKPHAPWTEVTMMDMFGFMALIVHMGFVQCTSFTDYWRESILYNISFPKEIMTEEKFLSISGALHLSSRADDAANELNRGTAAYDRRGRIKPLYNSLREGCRRNYHPAQDICIDERMVASKALIGLKHYRKSKHIQGGFKLFELTDSVSRYTWDFFVYDGKSRGDPSKGLGYSVVTTLTDTNLLGTGYKLFVNFDTNPILFEDLLKKNVWASGTIQTNEDGSPKTTYKTVDSRPPRGSLPWMRNDSVVLHKTQKWYKTLFYHFMDIAILNAFILFREDCKDKGQLDINQKAFRETLASELAEAASATSSHYVPPAGHHRPVHISGDSTKGRLRCRRCFAKTAVKCATCDTPLCFQPTRDCYNEWHIDKGI